jgi:hypothetical protein
MSEREKAIEEMKSLIAKKNQCDSDDVDFINGLDLGTTWESGQDFQADFTCGNDEGIVYWSTVSQEAYC